MRTFDILLTGRTLPGFEANGAVAALAGMLRVPEDKARELLAGRETVVKRGITEDQLPPYVEALRKCGAEVRAREQGPDTVKCPACGAEQPPRNLCRACGADMKRFAAAQEAAKNPPKQKAVEAVSTTGRAAVQMTSEPPLYRRTFFISFLFFFFLTPYWGWKVMTDAEFGKIARSFGALVLIGFTVQLVMLVNDVRKHGWLGEDEPVLKALRYAIDTRKQVDEFTLANSRFPDRGEISIGEKPGSVESVEVGPRGRVRVVLGADVERAPGGWVVLTPYLNDKGGWTWECQLAGIDEPLLAKQCTMNP
jgi:hypothetical protein